MPKINYESDVPKVESSIKTGGIKVDSLWEAIYVDIPEIGVKRQVYFARNGDRTMGEKLSALFSKYRAFVPDNHILVFRDKTLEATLIVAEIPSFKIQLKIIQMIKERIYQREVYS